MKWIICGMFIEMKSSGYCQLAMKKINMTIWNNIKNKIFYLSAVYLRPSYIVVIWLDYRNKFETIYADVDHLNAAIRWLVQAHNRTSLGVVSDGGIFKSEIIVATKLGILNNH